jgi:hypothetical protein
VHGIDPVSSEVRCRLAGGAEADADSGATITLVPSKDAACVVCEVPGVATGVLLGGDPCIPLACVLAVGLEEEKKRCKYSR